MNILYCTAPLAQSWIEKAHVQKRAHGMSNGCKSHYFILRKEHWGCKITDVLQKYFYDSLKHEKIMIYKNLVPMV